MEEGPSDGDEQIGGRAGNWESGAEYWEIWGGGFTCSRTHTHPADASYFKVRRFHDSRNMVDISPEREARWMNRGVAIYSFALTVHYSRKALNESS